MYGIGTGGICFSAAAFSFAALMIASTSLEEPTFCIWNKFAILDRDGEQQTGERLEPDGMRPDLGTL